MKNFNNLFCYSIYLYRIVSYTYNLYALTNFAMTTSHFDFSILVFVVFCIGFGFGGMYFNDGLDSLVCSDSSVSKMSAKLDALQRMED